MSATPEAPIKDTEFSNAAEQDELLEDFNFYISETSSLAYSAVSADDDEVSDPSRGETCFEGSNDIGTSSQDIGMEASTQERGPDKLAAVLPAAPVTSKLPVPQAFPSSSGPEEDIQGTPGSGSKSTTRAPSVAECHGPLFRQRQASSLDRPRVSKARRASQPAFTAIFPLDAATHLRRHSDQDNLRNERLALYITHLDDGAPLPRRALPRNVGQMEGRVTTTRNPRSIPWRLQLQKLVQGFRRQDKVVPLTAG